MSLVLLSLQDIQHADAAEKALKVATELQPTIGKDVHDMLNMAAGSTRCCFDQQDSLSSYTLSILCVHTAGRHFPCNSASLVSAVWLVLASVIMLA